MSVDPALASYLGNRADKLPGQGGVFNPVNLALYCYAGNNPLSYRDPDGLANEPLTEDQINTIKNTIVKNWDNNQFVDENGVRWFDQNIFDNVLNIGEGVNNLGCNLATNINILSQEYTRQNFGKSMSQEQFIDLFVTEYNSSNISPYARLMKPEIDFLNTGNQALGLKGKWQNKANLSPMASTSNNLCDSKTFFNLTSEYKIIQQESPLGGSHYVNGEKPNIAGWKSSYFDVYYGKEDRVVGGSKISEKILQNIWIIK